MKRAFVVKGRLSGSRTVELAEPVDGVEIEVEVIVREAQNTIPPPEATESPVAKFRRDEVDAALARKAPHLEVVYERAPSDGRDATADTGMIVARRRLIEPAKREGHEGEEEDTNPDLRLPTPRQ